MIARMLSLSPRWRRAVTATAIASLVVGGGVAVATTAQAAAGCRVVYSVPSQWPGGFTANVEHHQPRRPDQRLAGWCGRSRPASR